MQINEECIRDTLKYLAEALDVVVMDNEFYRYDIISAPDISTNLPEYTMKDILYSLKILNENNFITGYNLNANDEAQDYNDVVIYDVTYRGHQFLESIKPEDIWNKTKSVIAKIGIHTLNFIE